MIREILSYPDPRLRQVSETVERFDESLRGLVADMFETMHHAEGIGLAAIQIGVPLRLAVMEVEENPERVIVNPTYQCLGAPMELSEGCLSVPEVRGLTRTRSDHVAVQALDIDGVPFSFEARGIEAVCVQHECDHISGKLYIDRLTSVRRRRVLKQYHKEHRGRANDGGSAAP